VPTIARHSTTRKVLVLFTLVVFISTIMSPFAALAVDPDPSASPTASQSAEPSAPEATASEEPSPSQPAASEEPSGPPTIASDKSDYAPGELVTLSGSNWQAGEAVHIFVNDDGGMTWSRNADVVADDSGDITDQFSLPNWFVATYSVFATGDASGTVTTSFTDGTINGATIQMRNAACTTAQTSFVTGATACAHVEATIQGGGSTAWRIQWYAPGVVPATGTPAQDTLYTESAGTTTVTKNETFAVSTVGTWTLVVCKTANAGSCSGGNQVTTATFTVTAPSCTAPLVTTHPSAQAITYGANAIFSAAASGSPAPTVKWQLNTGSGYSDISPAETSASLTITKPGVVMSGNSYRAVFTNSCGSANSNGALLTVSAKNLTISGALANNKAYDGTTTATVDFTSASLVGVVAGDSVSINSSGYGANFNNANVANGKPVTVTGVALSGAAAGNYTVSQPSGLTANITVKSVTVTPDSGQSKVYGDSDPTLTYTLSESVPVTGQLGRAAGEDVGDYAIDLGSLVTSSANHSLVLSSTPVTFAVTPKDVTGSFTASDKTYDGTDAASVVTTTVNGAISGDDVSLSYSDATFDNANAGPGKTVTLNGTGLSGAQAGNYNLTGVGTTTAEIFKADADCSSIAGDTVTYDGDAHGASGTCNDLDGAALAGLDLGDSFTDVPGGTANWTFTDVSGNYNDDDGSVAIVINKRSLTVTADAKSKVFGTSDPAFTWHLTSGNLIGTDAISGSLGRSGVGTTAGEAVGNHPILQGSLTAGSNYDLHYVGADLAITAWTALGTGFYQPVGVPNSYFVPAPAGPPTPTLATIWNSVKGGSTVPLKFNLFAGTVERTDLAAINSFTATKVNCVSGSTEDSVDFVTTGNTTLRYDGGQWIQNWKTPGGTDCYRATAKFADGSTLSAFFKLKK
jgi:hypothetical protein